MTLEKGNDNISESHKQYLLDRHGTFELDPLPSMNDSDPLNWSWSVKITQLVLVSFHGFFATFMASGQVPAFGPFAEQFHKSINACSYLTSAQIIILGWLPWVWLPVMNRYGRWKLLMVSTLGSMAFNLVSIFCTGYGALMAMRCLLAFFISPGIAVGGAIAGETTFSHQRASRNGLWALSVTLGTVAGPIFMGLVVERVSTKYIYVVFTAVNGLQFLAYLLFGKETLFNYADLSRNKQALWHFLPIRDTVKLDLSVIFNPARLFFNWRVFLIAISYGVVFTYVNIAANVDLPVIFVEKFEMGPQAIGLQFISFLIGMITGEQFGGWMSDRWMIAAARKQKGSQHRLWLSYPGYITSIVGLIVFGCQVQNLRHYNITPLIGIVIASFGLQLITTTLISFGIDITGAPSDVALFMTALRQTFAFTGPFYFPRMFESLGYAGTFGLLAGLVAAAGWLPVAIIHFTENRRKNLLLEETEK